MRFLSLNSLILDRHFLVFVKEIIISMIPYAGPSILQWWYSITFIIQLPLHFSELAIYVMLMSKLVRDGNAKSVLIMMSAVIVIINISWQTIHPLPTVMLKTMKQSQTMSHRCSIYLSCLQLKIVCLVTCFQQSCKMTISFFSLFETQESKAYLRRSKFIIYSVPLLPRKNCDMSVDRIIATLWITLLQFLCLFVYKKCSIIIS